MPGMKEALLYQKEKNKLKCAVCQRRCLVAEDKYGFCQTRVNKKGRFYTLLYGMATGIQVDPIEKKPFYHFKPGSLVASIGSVGCNFRCKQCLNWFQTWKSPEIEFLKNGKEINYISPEEVVKAVISKGFQGIAFTYNEPTIWLEYALDIAKIFKKRSPQHFCVFVTNGSWTKEAIDLISPYIDAANIDFKGFSQKTYQRQGAFFGQVPEMTIYCQKKGIFLEITTLLIPGINDNPEELKKMTGWMAKSLGEDTPWHLSQFDPEAAPDPEFQKIPPTSVENLEKAAQIGKKAGLNHIYTWAPGANYAKSDTYCPKCKKIVIQRSGWQPEKINISNQQKCQFCSYKLNIIL